MNCVSAELSCPRSHPWATLPLLHLQLLRVNSREKLAFSVFSVSFLSPFLGPGAVCCSLVAPEPVPSPLQDLCANTHAEVLQDHPLLHLSHTHHAVLSLTGWQAGLVAESVQLRETRHLGTTGGGWAQQEPVCVKNRSHTQRHIGVSSLSCVCALKCQQKNK